MSISTKQVKCTSSFPWGSLQKWSTFTLSFYCSIILVSVTPPTSVENTGPSSWSQIVWNAFSHAAQFPLSWFAFVVHRGPRSAPPPDRLPVQRDLRDPHHDHRLREPAHVQHVLPESQSVPVRPPRRLRWHGANHRRWSGNWSHHRHPHLHHHTVGWVLHVCRKGEPTEARCCHTRKKTAHDDVITRKLLYHKTIVSFWQFNIFWATFQEVRGQLHIFT